MKRLLLIYQFLSSVLFSTLLLVLLLNLASWLYLKATLPQEEQFKLYEIIDFDAYNYGNIETSTDSMEVIHRVDSYLAFLKNGGREYEYHPATEYQLAPLSLPGVYVSKQEDGFNIRQNEQSEISGKDKKIYCFGGSTTFGSFVRDNETWPAYLDQTLDSVNVLNYGVPGFVPTQETKQFIHLLKLGYRPSLCIFMDGVNIGPPYDGSDFTKSIYKKFNENTLNKQPFQAFIAELPIVKLFQKRPLHEPLDLFRSLDVDMADLESSAVNNELIAQRFIANAKIRQAVAQAYQVDIIQFLQPNTSYAYPDKYLTAMASKNHENEAAKMLAANTRIIYHKVLSAGCGYLDLSKLFQLYDKPAVVDFIHYSPGFNKFIADYIATKHLSQEELKDFEYKPTMSTGIPFEVQD